MIVIAWSDEEPKDDPPEEGEEIFGSFVTFIALIEGEDSTR